MSALPLPPVNQMAHSENSRSNTNERVPPTRNLTIRRVGNVAIPVDEARGVYVQIRPVVDVDQAFDHGSCRGIAAIARLAEFNSVVESSAYSVS
jgi:hypothetical protein